MTGPILYLCGPMTGLPEHNHPAFNAAAASLRAAGYHVINPAETSLPADAPWISHMRKDISDMVSTCDAVAFLPGCEQSRGAPIEMTLAQNLGWPVCAVFTWLELARLPRSTEHLTD